MMKRSKRLLTFLLALSLLAGLAAPALAAETAAVLRLTKTTGTVEISKSSGKSVSLLKNMRLYNGYHVSTEEESYAWINLDDSKLLKEDAESEVEVRKDGKSLEVLTVSGNVFFDVAKPLEDNESMNIRTSTMAVGIRGTSGWIEVLDRWTTRVSVLEGVVECSVADPVTGQLKSEKIYGGETALCVVYPQEKTGDKSAILRDKYTVDDIPGFVLTDLVRDIPLCDKIESETDLDIPRDLASVAGGDPSGREPDGEHATKEVLGEADRREDEDEDELHKKLEEIEKELEKQPEYVSPSKPLEKPSTPAPSDRDDDSDSGSDSGTTTPAPTPPEPETYTIIFSANGGAWNGAAERTVQTSPDGTVTLPEAPTRSGYSFSGWYDAPTGGTQIAAGSVFTADAAVYAHWTENALPPVGYAVTFNTNGGTLSSPTTVRTNEAGKLTTWPENPRYGEVPTETEPNIGLKFLGWFDALVDGTEYTASSTFAANTTLYAHWDGWYIDSTGILTVSGQMDKYFSISQGSSASGYYIYPEWVDVGENINEAVILEGPTKLGCSRSDAGGAFEWYRDLTRVTIPNSVTTIGQYSFLQCTGLTSIAIPDSVTTIEGSAFYACAGLTDITIPSKVTTIENCAFEGCSSLRSVVIPEGVSSIEERTFRDCTALASVTIPSSVTNIGYQAFSNCSSLTNVIIPEHVTSIGYSAFDGCSSLTSVEIPASVTSIGNGAFSNCSSLTNITVDKANSTYSSDGIALFDQDKKTLIQFPKGYSGSYELPSTVTSIGSFGPCPGLTSITIPGSVTSIGQKAFSSCPGLTSVTIQAGVASIGDFAFRYCSNLKTINYTGSESDWKNISKGYETLPSGVTINYNYTLPANP